MAADFVLTTASTIKCEHPVAGTFTITPSLRLKVAGAGVLVQGAGPVPIATPCGQPANPPTTSPCGPITVSGGFASRLVVDGVPVLLAGTFAATPSAPPPAPLVPYVAVAGQTLLQAE